MTDRCAHILKIKIVSFREGQRAYFSAFQGESGKEEPVVQLWEKGKKPSLQNKNGMLLAEKEPLEKKMAASFRGNRSVRGMSRNQTCILSIRGEKEQSGQLEMPRNVSTERIHWKEVYMWRKLQRFTKKGGCVQVFKLVAAKKKKETL